MMVLVLFFCFCSVQVCLVCVCFSLCFSSVPPIEIRAHWSETTFFISIFLLSCLANTRKEQIKGQIPPFHVSSGPTHPNPVFSLWLTYPNNYFILVFSLAVWAQDVFIYKGRCIIDALLLLPGTVLSEMATSKTMCTACFGGNVHGCMREGESVSCTSLWFKLQKDFLVWQSSCNQHTNTNTNTNTPSVHCHTQYKFLFNQKLDSTNDQSKQPDMTGQVRGYLDLWSIL